MEFSNETFTDFFSRYVAKNKFLLGKLQMQFWRNQWGFPCSLDDKHGARYARVHNLMEFSNETFTDFSSLYITNNVFLVGKLRMWFWKNQ